MKRAGALSKIRHCGYNGDTDGMAKILIIKNVGTKAARQAFMAGKRLKDLGLPCDCTECASNKGAKK